MERFRAKASKARQAQSRVKRLEKMERIERDPRDTRDAGVLVQGSPSARAAWCSSWRAGGSRCPGACCSRTPSLWVERGEHVTLVGGNGSGKTTLIETLTGAPSCPTGKLRTGHNVTVGYVSQHAEELTGDGTVLDAAQRATGLTPGKARALLGQFLFSGEDAEKPVDGLSGGELRRLSLAVLVNSGANMLVLDEPTNHLDVESREALEDALTGFPGSLLLVSHDRALLDAVGTRTFAIEDGRAAQLRGRLGRVRGGARGAAAPRTAEPPAPSRRSRRPRRSRGRQPQQRAVEERRSAPSATWSARSRPPRPRCGRSRTSWRTPARGPTRTELGESRASATPTPGASSRSCTRAGRRRPS